MANFRQEIIAELNKNERLYDAELLNLMLSNAFAGKDTSAIAKKLTSYFPSIGAIFNADAEEISAVSGVPKRVAEYLKVVSVVYKHMHSRPVKIAHNDEFIQTVKERLTGRDCEYVELYFLNRNGAVLDVKSYTSHSSNSVNVAVTDLLAAISSSDASKIYCAHNHVTGSPEPSAADDATTLKLLSACNICKISFCDHCIVNSAGEVYSYMKSGKLALLQDKLKDN